MAATTTDSAQRQVQRRSGADLSTLVVASLAAVVAAVVTSRLWSSGTLVSTAMTPVIIALVKEYLQRPVERIHEVARAPLVAVRSNVTAPMPIGARRGAPPEAARRGRVLDEPGAPDPRDYERLDAVVPPGEDPSADAPYRVYRQRVRGPSRAWWRVGLVTGLAAFLVAAVALTVPELVGGSSVAGPGRTTLFSSQGSHHTATTEQNTTSTASPGSSGTTTSSSPDSSSGQSATPAPSNTTSTPSSGGSQASPTPASPQASPTPTTPSATPSAPSSSSGGGQ